MDHFMKVSKAAEASRLELKDSVLQCLPPSILNIESETTCNLIPEYVPTPISKLSSVSLPPSESTSTFVKCSDPFYQDQPVIAYPVCEGVELNSNEDSRVVTVAGSVNENLDDCGMEADIVGIDGMNDKAGESEHENILDQLLPGEEVMDLNIVPHEKRKAEEGSGVEAKKQKGFDVKDVGEKTLIAVMSELMGVMNKNVKAVDRLEKLMVDTACVMAKLADSVTRLKWTIEEREKQEEKREEKREEEDRKREEERRRDERRRRDGWRSMREPRHRDHDKENGRRLKSTIGTSYTASRMEEKTERRN